MGRGELQECNSRRTVLWDGVNCKNVTAGMNVSEEDTKEIDREELVVCTGGIYTYDWPKFLQFSVQSTYSFHLLQHPPKPD